MNTAFHSSTATFAGGCFWGVQAAFDALQGVIDTEVGYTGGHRQDPTYADVCSGATGHAEAVRVTYDPTQVSYEQLLDVFWALHDPTQKDGQGLDTGTQYRSAIFFHDEVQRNIAESSKQVQQQSGKWGARRIVTELCAAGVFYRAEEYHQHYIEKQAIR